MKEESRGRVEQPSWKMNVICWREPWRDAQSCHVSSEEAVEMKS